jgi:hypothetical protein
MPAQERKKKSKKNQKIKEKIPKKVLKKWDPLNDALIPELFEFLHSKQ